MENVFLEAIASPSNYPFQSFILVIDSLRMGDSYRIYQACELVSASLTHFKWSNQLRNMTPLVVF